MTGDKRAKLTSVVRFQSGHELQVIVSAGLGQKRSAKMLWLDCHDASTVLLDLPGRCRIGDERVSHEFDRSRFSVEKNVVASSDLFSGSIS
jgi:hypothetical protein